MAGGGGGGQDRVGGLEVGGVTASSSQHHPLLHTAAPPTHDEHLELPPTFFEEDVSQVDDVDPFVDPFEHEEFFSPRGFDSP